VKAGKMPADGCGSRPLWYTFNSFAIVDMQG
jgi:hypothetical protein